MWSLCLSYNINKIFGGWSYFAWFLLHNIFGPARRISGIGQLIMAESKTNIRKRGIIKGKLTRLETRVSAYDLSDPSTLTGLSISKLKIQLEMLQQAWKEFVCIQDIIIQEDEESEEQEEREYLYQEERYLEIKSTLMDLITFMESSKSFLLKETVADASSIPLQLPRLNLPTFAGDYKNWISFYDLFNASVHSNSCLSDAHKLHYLKSSLQGEAARLLKSLQITDSNYQLARNILEERYSNMRVIIRSHIHTLCSYPCLRQENSKTLRQLIEMFHENILSLKALEIDIDTWSPFLVYQLSEKLDDETRRQWEISSPGRDLQTYRQLYEFLDTRCRALEASNLKLSSTCSSLTRFKPRDKPRTEAHSYQATVGICSCCKEDHRINQCPKFIAMDYKGRTDFISKSRLCFNCLGRGHIGKSCKSLATCRTCRKRHHTLLHFDSENVPETSLDSNLQCGQCRINPTSVLLATAMVPVVTSKGIYSCRALLDSGSQASFITEACVQQMGLKRHHHDIHIDGIGQGAKSKANGMVDLILKPPNNNSVEVSAVILQKNYKEIADASYFDFRLEAHKGS